jgi:hypothetical protein
MNLYFVHRQDYLRNQENKKLGVEFKKVDFPDNQHLVLPDFSYRGYPQLSLACKDVRLKKFLYLIIYDKSFSQNYQYGNMIFCFHMKMKKVVCLQIVLLLLLLNFIHFKIYRIIQIGV